MTLGRTCAVSDGYSQLGCTSGGAAASVQKERKVRVSVEAAEAAEAMRPVMKVGCVVCGRIEVV